MRILLNQHLSGGNGVGLKPSPSSGVPHPAKPVPEEIKKTTFNDDINVGNYEPVQLPERTVTPKVEAPKEKKEAKEEIAPEGGGTQGSEGNGSEPPVKEVAASAAPEDNGDKETNKENAQAPAPEQKVETEQGAEKKEDGINKFLKPPVSKGAEKKDEKGVTQGQARDYSGYTPEETALLKQMSNPAFELASKAIKENKELSKLKSTTYLQHEQAYILDPEYQREYQQMANVQKEFQHWQEQLIAIDGGKKWKPLKGWDKDGNPVYDAERDPSKMDEENVRRWANNCDQAARQLQGKLAAAPTLYKNRVTQDTQAIENERKNRFAWVANPELMEHSIKVGDQDVPLKKIREDYVNLYPPYMRSHPALAAGGDLLIALQLANAEIQELKGAQQVKQIKQEEEGRVEPSSRQAPRAQAKPIHGVKTFEALPPGF